MYNHDTLNRGYTEPRTMAIQIPVESLTLNSEQAQIVNLLISTKGRNKGLLRESPPTHPTHFKDKNEVEILQAKAYYVWRNVVFLVGEQRQHHAMPVLADSYLPGTYEERAAMAKELNKLVDLITHSIPKEQWHGVIRWGRALGQFQL